MSASIISPGPRVPAIGRNRILYRAGVPVAALVGGEAVRLEGVGRPPPSMEKALVRRRVPPTVRAYLGSKG